MVVIHKSQPFSRKRYIIKNFLSVFFLYILFLFAFFLRFFWCAEAVTDWNAVEQLFDRGIFPSAPKFVLVISSFFSMHE
jgi:hypothetical protein